MDSNSPLPVSAIKAARLNPLQQAQAQAELIRNRYWVCCANCLHNDSHTDVLTGIVSGTGVCERHNIIPLPQFAVLGCPDWDGLPF